MRRRSLLSLVALIGLAGCGKPTRPPAEAKGPPPRFTQNKLATFGAPGQAGPAPPMAANPRK